MVIIHGFGDDPDAPLCGNPDKKLPIVAASLLSETGETGNVRFCRKCIELYETDRERWDAAADQVFLQAVSKVREANLELATATQRGLPKEELNPYAKAALLEMIKAIKCRGVAATEAHLRQEGLK